MKRFLLCRTSFVVPPSSVPSHIYIYTYVYVFSGWFASWTELLQNRTPHLIKKCSVCEISFVWCHCQRKHVLEPTLAPAGSKNTAQHKVRQTSRNAGTGQASLGVCLQSGMIAGRARWTRSLRTLWRRRTIGSGNCKMYCGLLVETRNGLRTSIFRTLVVC